MKYPRPLRIFTSSHEQKMLVLSKQHDAFLKVDAIAALGTKPFLRHDLTPRQLDHDRNLREELRMKRELDKSHNYKIRGGRIIALPLARASLVPSSHLPVANQGKSTPMWFEATWAP